MERESFYTCKYANVDCLFKANPLKRTECELTASSERLTSATFLTSYYRVPCCHAATGSQELCTHNHKFTHSHTNTHRYKAKGTRTNTWKMHTNMYLSSGIVTFLPDIPATVCQRGLELEGHYGWRVDERAESQILHVTWSNGEDLRLIRFHIGSMVLWLQNARYGSEIRL